MHLQKSRFPLFLALAAIAICFIDNGARAGVTARAEDGPPDLPIPAIRKRLVTTMDLRSKEGVEYRIFVSTPQGAPPTTGFPVLYVLDANAWFGIAAEVARVFENGADPCLVVGIGYPIKGLWSPRQRTFDSTMESKTPVDQPQWKTGGNEAFLNFITETVKPRIEATHKIDRSRQALFGHSLTGLFVLHALFAKPDAFTLFIAASPSIWWGDFAVNEEEAAFEAHRPSSSPRVLLSVGGKEATFVPSAGMREALLKHPELLGGRPVDDVMASYEKLALSYRMVAAAKDLSERLSSAGVKAQFIEYPGEDHITEAPMAITRSLEMLLENFD